MSVAYRAVGWNPQKRRYDAMLIVAIVLYLATFIAVGFATHPEATLETLLLRAFGTGALLLLHVVLAIGPLCRLDRRFLPLLYNRRHLGVATFTLGLAHGLLALIQFHAFGDLDPLVSLLSAETGFDRLSAFPFQILGAAALLILLLMAATSHDFWLENLSPRVWKALHMSVYLGYALLVAHVACGALVQEDRSFFDGCLLAGFLALFLLHGVAGWRELRFDHARNDARRDGFVRAARLDDLPLDEGRTVALGGERIALFRQQDGVSALGNVCRHQGGPLGEGRIVAGCVTCPWHGYQYLAENGCSPPPFTEKVETYRVRVIDRDVYVDPQALPPGTPVAKAQSPALAVAPFAETDFYVGYLPRMPERLRSFIGRAVVLLVVGAIGLSATLAATQSHFSNGAFEFGTVRTFEGIIDEFPVPALLVERPGAGALSDRFSRYLLVDSFKFGAGPRITGLDGKHVRLSGTLIHRAGQAMIELTAAAPEPLPSGQRSTPDGTGERPSDEDLGRHQLRGEIVDSKCWLGVMKPGDWTVHRACATRCIRGGIPPLLVVNDRAGGSLEFLLVSPTGESVNAAILDRIAEPVSVTGQVVRRGATLFLYADPVDIRRP